MNKIFRVTLPCGLALLALAALFFVVDASALASSSQPGTQSALTVTTLEDELNTDGDCSLREALTAANTNATVDACPAGDAVLTDTVTFAVAGTITVTSQLSVTAGGPLVVNGGGVITTSGGGTTRVWWVEPGSVLTLQHLGVTDGYAYDGAGLFNDGGNLIVLQSRFSENTFIAGEGGGILTQGGTLQVIISYFEANGSDDEGSVGGAIAIQDSTGMIVSSTFLSNFSVGSDNIFRAGGGAVWVSGASPVTIYESHFLSNTSQYQGGGIGVVVGPEHSTLNIRNSAFSGNHTDGLWMGGGAIFVCGSVEMTITNSILSGNTSGGVAGAIQNSGDRLTVINSTLSDNSAIEEGGAIYNYWGLMTVIDSALFGNSTGYSGGAIYNASSITVINSTLSENTAAIAGGGIFNMDTMTLTSSTISGNSTGFGGAIDNSGPLTITNSIITTSLSEDDCWGLITDGGHNISSDDTCGFDPANGSMPNTDPLLGPLQDNGGPTLTHALLPGSPAIDAGDDTQCPATDQRGMLRPFDGDHDGTATCDIGAYEAYCGMIYYAAPTAQGTGDCLTWADACTLQTALSIASSGNQIWVQAGTHLPTCGIDRTISFALKDGVAIYGGFAGDETELGQRDWSANLTTLSGDIGVMGVITDNTYHVVRGSGVTETAVLDGFTISGGNANGGEPHDRGGGMNIDNSSPGLANITFGGNTAWAGGGMSNYYFSSPVLTNVTFSGNTAGVGGGMYNWASSPSLENVTFNGNEASVNGGGMHNDSSNTILANVTFTSNISGWDGGGMYNYSSSPSLVNVTFNGNAAYKHGGGMYNEYSNPSLANVAFSSNATDGHGGGVSNFSSNPILTNVSFNDNSAYWSGGGIFNYSSSPTLTNVTFSGNTADYGSGMSNYYFSSPSLTNVTFSGNTATYDGGGMRNIDSSPSLTNCILWGNPGGDFSNDSNTTVVAYSDIGGCGGSGDWNGACGTDGGGNIDLDPLLGPLQDNGGATLTHALLHGSPAIDAGDNGACPTTDQRGVPRPLDGNSDGVPVCDMGAYEFEHGIHLIPAQQSASAAPGGTLEYTLTLYNFTPLTDTYSLALGPHAWETNLSASQVGPLQPGETSVFTASITIPPDATWYQIDSAVITATSATSPIIYSDTAHLATQAYATPVISVSPLALDSTQYPGELITQTLTISNGNGVTLTFAISETAAWLAIAPSNGFVNTSSALPVQVSFQAGSLMSGTYTTTLAVASNDPLSPVVHIPVTMVVTTVRPAAIAIAGPSGGLASQLYAFTATVAPPTTTLPITYIWQVDGQASITHTDGLSDTASFIWPMPGSYTLTVRAANYGGAVTATHAITITDAPVVGLVAVNDSPTLVGYPTTFTATITAGTNVTFTWNFGGDSSGSGAIVTHTYAALGVYTATVTAVNATNALSSTTLVTVIEPEQPCRVYLPQIQSNPAMQPGSEEHGISVRWAYSPDHGGPGRLQTNRKVQQKEFAEK